MMGGDLGPEAAVAGAALAVSKDSRMVPILVGDKSRIEPLLSHYPSLVGAEIVHTEDVVASDQKPSVALRSGRNSSMRLAIDLVKQGKADAAVSSGNTGALMAMAIIELRTLEGIARPALVTYMPTSKGRSCMLDLGANIECDADNLVQFAMMGHAFMRATSDIESPTIGLLNVGEEEQKGKDVLRQASAILSDADNGLNYVGFVEGDDIVKGTVDIIVADGFSGNIAIKSMEGLAMWIRTMLRQSFKSSFLARLGYMLAHSALLKFRTQLDPQRHNGAVLLGLNGTVIKSHGSATAEGIARALEIALDLFDNEFMADVKKSLKRSVRAVENAKKQAEAESES